VDSVNALKMYGIYFADDAKKDGSPKCGRITNHFSFLGVDAYLNPVNGGEPSISLGTAGIASFYTDEEKLEEMFKEYYQNNEYDYLDRQKRPKE